MTIETAVSVDLMLGGWLLVLSLGYQTSPVDTVFLVRHPLLFARALFPIFVLVPAFAVLVTRTLPLAPAIRFAIATLAVSPVLPTLPLKQMKVGSNVGSNGNYAVALVVAASLGALVATPLLVRLASSVLNVSADISTPEVAEIVALSTGFPLVAGMLVRIVVGPSLEVFSRTARIVGNVFLMGGLLIALVSTWPILMNLPGNGALVVMIATAMVSLCAGHLFWNDSRENRNALALATATRHPGVAIAIAKGDFPNQQHSAIAAVLLFLFINAMVTALYMQWVTRQR